MPTTKPSWNLVANLAARGWGMLAGFLFVPFYVRLVGGEAYGLVTFAATLQVALTVAAVGWTKSLRREFASESAGRYSGPAERKFKLFRSFEVTYVVFAALIMGVCWSVAPWLATSFLATGALATDVVLWSLRLMGFSIGLQVLFSAYSGCLFGLNLQVRANAMEVSWSLIRSVGGVLALHFITPSLVTLFVWWLAADLVYTVVVRWQAYRAVRANDAGASGWSWRDLSDLASMWRMALGLTVVSVVYVVNTQTDRTIISSQLGLLELGAYNLAFALGQVPIVLTTAIATTIQPVLTKAFTAGEYDRMNAIYRSYRLAGSLGVAALAAFISVFAVPILELWAGSEELVTLAAPVVPLVVAGNAMLALQQVTYEYLLARGVTWVNVTMSALSVPFVVIVTPAMIEQAGMMGAGASWCILMSVSTLFYLGYTSWRYLAEGPHRSLILVVGAPGVIAVVAALACRWSASALGASAWGHLGLAFVGGSVLVSAFAVVWVRGRRLRDEGEFDAGGGESVL